VEKSSIKTDVANRTWRKQHRRAETRSLKRVNMKKAMMAVLLAAAVLSACGGGPSENSASLTMPVQNPATAPV
jgi:hypothetical protein